MHKPVSKFVVLKMSGNTAAESITDDVMTRSNQCTPATNQH